MFTSSRGCARNDLGGLAISPWRLLSRRLGFAGSDLLPAAEVVRRSKWLSLAGINIYPGTQLDVASYRSPLRLTTALAAEVHARLDLSVNEINLGGGMPSPSLRRRGLDRLRRRPEHDRAFQDDPRILEEFAAKLSSEFLEAATRTGLRPLPALSVEPGRSLVGNAAIVVARVRAVDRSWVFVDASHNYLPESAILFSRAVLPVIRSGAGPERYYHFSGNTLNTLDVIAFRCRLPLLREGDLVVFGDAGAYSISRASRYAGLSPAAHLVGVDGSRRMIRRAESVADLTAPMMMPPGGDGDRAASE
jgi:diaminopimelate decarboxylase